MFEHIAEQRSFGADGWRAAPSKTSSTWRMDFFALGIEQRLRDLEVGQSAFQRELHIRSVGLAENLLSLLRRWLDRGARKAAADMDRIFHIDDVERGST
jgi:hypothetical protein